ncbi:o-succinylbenzoate--CoA ligase [Kribbella sp. ALI-6-A]|uniref:class I adenylate-forming enzyme family protein n=1 Tax=Kribbella sp. ALI-6-A TaxID=1933817 RepID=UPI00097C7870|nr:fatty acid--CoA ligase family protein [Kribbella sp. ALI-6-A]ONI66801.1 o-succinylbenzoate--CoA ligase [Kribbella sp. ALI-6-A]
MRPGELVPLRGGPLGELVNRIRAVREAGAIPLVGDDRWSEAYWQQLAEAARRTTPHPKLAWAASTSGSSGTPRIVLRSETSWASSFALIADLLEVDSDDAIALPAPPASSLTLFSLAHALAGGPRPVMSEAHSIAAADYQDATCFHGTPQAFRALLDAPPPRLKSALIGGSRLDPVLRTRAEALGIRVIAYYGAAELSFVAADSGEGLRSLPGVELRVEQNELWVRSPFVAHTYADRPLRRDGEWVTAGDRAELGNDGLRLLGRSDDAILTASATVVPEEVETLLRTLPGVSDAAVIGVPHPTLGAVVVAVIEAERQSRPKLSELKEASRELLAPAHRPRRWFVGDLPRTASGKPQRARLRRAIETGEVASLD